MKTLPCKECIALAACKSKSEISCPLLYEYFAEGGIRNAHMDGSDYYTHPQVDRLKEMEVFFDKSLYRWETTFKDYWSKVNYLVLDLR